MKKFLLIIIGILCLVAILVVVMGVFDVLTFFGILFYVLLYSLGYYYIRVGFKRQEEELRIHEGRKHKFEWCFEQVNKILKTMPGGQGLQWSKGVGRRSEYRTYFDGIQNKPFRSILAYLENTQQVVLVIYNIDDDDIASFITNPGVEYYDNPFFEFKPYMRSAGVGGYGRDGYGYGGEGIINPYDFSGRKRGRGLSINIGGDDNYNDFDEMQRRMTEPKSDVVDRAVQKLGDRR